MTHFQLKNDPGFREFVDAHKNRSTKSTWSNDDQLKQGQEVANVDSTNIEVDKKEKKKKETKSKTSKNSVSDLDVSIEIIYIFIYVGMCK